MARTFNRAYDQADRILNGSGLSSIVYRQGAGRIATDTLKRVPTYAKNYLKGVANKIWYDLTGETLSDTTREDMTKGEAAALEEGIAEAVVTGKGEFGNLGTEFEDWVGLGEKGNVRRDAEAIVGGASVSWNPETGEYGFKDKYDFPVYEAPGKFRDEVESINAWLEERGNRRDQIVDPTGGLGGILLGNFFPQNRLFGIGLGLGSRIVGKSENVPYFDEKTGKDTTRHVPYAGAFHTSMGISPQKVQDISEKHDFFGVLDPLQKVKTHTGGTGSGFGLVGGDLSVRAEPASSGYSYDPDTDTTFLDGAAIDTTSGLKHGGQTMSRGLSGIKKSININGQPHSLAWINPGEASALKAMGGSGKKVDGIPAYFIDYFGGEDSTYSIDDFGAADSPPIIDSVPAYRDSSSEPTPAPAAPDSYWGYEPEPDFGRTGPGFLGSDATENDAEILWKTQYIQSGRPRHDPSTGKPVSVEEEWQKARNAPGGLEAIARGYQIGDPLGEQMRNSFNLINQQLQNRFTERGMQKLEFTQDEMTREELQNAAKNLVTDFEPFDGSLPAWMPAWMQAIGGFASRTVIGTGTVGGVGVHVHEDGTVTAVSPEDSPGYDPSAHHEPGSDVPFRYRSKPVRQASVSEEVEKPTGMAALLARRSTPASGQAALQPQIDTLVESGIPLEEAFKMLNINV